MCDLTGNTGSRTGCCHPGTSVSVIRAPASARNRSDPAFGGGFTRSPRGIKLAATVRILARIPFNSVDYDDEQEYREVLVALGLRGLLIVRPHWIQEPFIWRSRVHSGFVRRVVLGRAKRPCSRTFKTACHARSVLVRVECPSPCCCCERRRAVFRRFGSTWRLSVKGSSRTSIDSFDASG